MRVLLINPTQAHALDSEAGDLPEDGTGAHPPLGLLYLQAAVEASGGHRVDVIDANRGRSLAVRLRERYREGSPQLVGITALTPNLVGVVRTIQVVKDALPDAAVVIGGPHTDIFPRETAALEGVDYVLAGEAEPTLPRLVAAIEAGNVDGRIPGLFAADGSVDGLTDERPCLLDLDSTPPPDRTRIPVATYRGLVGGDEVFSTLVTSRGCPYRCTFCSTPRERYRQRSTSSILEEMEQCAGLGIRHIYFLDDNFPVKGWRLRELCDGIAARPHLPAWSCRTAAAGLTVDNLAAMKRAGCQRIQIGVETYTDEGLKVMGKATTVVQIRETFAAARRAGVQTMAYFMLGLPHERDADDVRAMVRLARELEPTYAMFNVLTLYPGTALFHMAVERGLVAGDVWQRFALDPDPSFAPPIWDEFLDRAQLAELLDDAYRSFYWRPSVVLRLARGGGLRRKARAAWHMVRPRAGGDDGIR